MSLDLPLLDAPPLVLPQGLGQLDDGAEGTDPQPVVSQARNQAPADALGLGRRTKLGVLATPRQASSAG
jgi:hypothetical protein